jgi:hypothetical protein
LAPVKPHTKYTAHRIAADLDYKLAAQHRQ